MTFSQHIKTALSSAIQEVVKNKDDFVVRAGIDFSRNKKMNLENLIDFMLAMEGNSIEKELFDFSCNTDTSLITKSAFVQSRAKIKWEAFEFLFHDFTARLPYNNTFKNHYLIACDGCEVYIPFNADDKETFINNGPDKSGWNRVHLNALYDILNRIYINAVITPGKHVDERGSLLKMLKNKPLLENSIIIADRGYPSFELLATLQSDNQKYLIRVKQPSGQSSLLRDVTLPKDEVFDVNVTFHSARNYKNMSSCSSGDKKIMNQKCKFSYFTDEKPYFTFCMRVVKLKLSENHYEYLLTNLKKEEFSTEDVAEMYHMRWDIETAFRELKYTLGLLNFHSKKVDFIKQEIFARLIMYNFCEIIAGQVVLQTRAARKYDYQINFTMAMRICKTFFQVQNKNPPNPETLIEKYILPVRKKRRFERKAKKRNPMSFLYRIA